YTWKPLAQIPETPRITCLETVGDTSSTDAVLVGTHGNGIWHLSQKGAALKRIRTVRALSHITALTSTVSEVGRPRLLACGWNSPLFVSENLGTSWWCSSRGLTTHRQADERRYGAPHFSTIATSALLRETYVGGFDGLFRTDATCSEWEAVETLSPD